MAARTTARKPRTRSIRLHGAPSRLSHIRASDAPMSSSVAPSGRRSRWPLTSATARVFAATRLDSSRMRRFSSSSAALSRLTLWCGSNIGWINFWKSSGRSEGLPTCSTARYWPLSRSSTTTASEPVGFESRKSTRTTVSSGKRNRQPSWSTPAPGAASSACQSASARRSLPFHVSPAQLESTRRRTSSRYWRCASVISEGSTPRAETHSTRAVTSDPARTSPVW